MVVELWKKRGGPRRGAPPLALGWREVGGGAPSLPLEGAPEGPVLPFALPSGAHIAHVLEGGTHPPTLPTCPPACEADSARCPCGVFTAVSVRGLGRAGASFFLRRFSLERERERELPWATHVHGLSAAV